MYVYFDEEDGRASFFSASLPQLIKKQMKLLAIVPIGFFKKKLNSIISNFILSKYHSSTERLSVKRFSYILTTNNTSALFNENQTHSVLYCSFVVSNINKIKI